MPLIHALPVAATTPGVPRASSTVSYAGTSNVLVHVQPLCPTWDTESTSIVLTVEVQQSFDTGTTWEDFARIDITPPQRNRHGEIPYMGCQCVDDRGPRIARVVLTVTNSTLSCGVDITV